MNGRWQLSCLGVGSDGSLGVKSIKEHGGLTLAQAEIEADDEAMRGMPWSAAATGSVDFVLPIEGHARQADGIPAPSQRGLRAQEW